MSFADSWYRASCALLLLTLHFSMFSFYLPLSFSLSLLLSLSLSLSFSLSLFISPPLFLSVVARHMSSDALYQIFSSWSILLFHTISFHSSYKIHQLFTDYLLRLPSSELLEKHLFRSRANRRLVCWLKLLVLCPFLWLELQQSVKHWANQLGLMRTGGKQNHCHPSSRLRYIVTVTL